MFLPQNDRPDALLNRMHAVHQGEPFPTHERALRDGKKVYLPNIIAVYVIEQLQAQLYIL